MDDDDIAGVAERLCEEFSGLLPIRVLEAVSDAAAEYGTYSPMFLEQAVRAQLLKQVAARARAAPVAQAAPGLSAAS
ncbi:MAG: hypothetical protein ACTHKG_01105 [Nocardioides sp.]